MNLQSILDSLSSTEDSYEECLDRLDEALEKLPLSRESAEEIMDAISSYDVLELYTALFDTFEDFLTEAEKQSIVQRYMDTFDTSERPWWAE